jgi:hypothetical protein
VASQGNLCEGISDRMKCLTMASMMNDLVEPSAYENKKIKA